MDVTPPQDRRLTNGPGRDKLSAEAVQAIIDGVQQGNVFDRAAALARISRTTFYRWVARGRDLQHDREQGWQGPLTERDTLLLQLVEGVDLAEALAENAALQIIRADGATGARWFLERKYPDRYGRRHRVDVGNADGQPFQTQALPMLDLSLLDDDEVAEFARLFRKATPLDAPVIELEARRELTA